MIFLQEAIEQGLGIGSLPSFVRAQALAEGRLEEILIDTRKPRLTLYALYPASQFLPPKLERCVDFMQQWAATESQYQAQHRKLNQASALIRQQS